MFRPREIRRRARALAESVLAASDAALSFEAEPTAVEHPHRRAAATPARARRPGRVAPTRVPCLSPLAHRPASRSGHRAGSARGA